jgi:hypothetical protein
MSQPRSKVVWGALALFAVLPASARAGVDTAQAPTCNQAEIRPESYALTTRAQARIVTAERMDWWDGFDVGTAFEALHDLNASSTWAAERALELDPKNLLASGVLARQLPKAIF